LPPSQKKLPVTVHNNEANDTGPVNVVVPGPKVAVFVTRFVIVALVPSMFVELELFEIIVSVLVVLALTV
jgi:hypothetical protein